MIYIRIFGCRCVIVICGFIGIWCVIGIFRGGGICASRIRGACRKLRKGKTASQIAEELEEDLPVIQNIVITAADFAPDYDTDAIFKWMVSER